MTPLKNRVIKNKLGEKFDAVPFVCYRGKVQRITDFYFRLKSGKLLTHYEIKKREWQIPWLDIYLEAQYTSPIFEKLIIDQLTDNSPLLSRASRFDTWTGGLVSVPVKYKTI